jgi:hypothetical protein
MKESIAKRLVDETKRDPLATCLAFAYWYLQMTNWLRVLPVDECFAQG